MKQLRSFLLNSGEACLGRKQKDLIASFASKVGEEISGDPNSWLIRFWASGKNQHVFKGDCDFIMSPEWRKVRKTALSKYGTFCMRCGRAGSASVDHIKPRSLFPDLALDPKNLQVLCVSCNSQKGNRSQKDYRISEESMKVQNL